LGTLTRTSSLFFCPFFLQLFTLTSQRGCSAATEELTKARREYERVENEDRDSGNLLRRDTEQLRELDREQLKRQQDCIKRRKEIEEAEEDLQQGTSSTMAAILESKEKLEGDLDLLSQQYRDIAKLIEEAIKNKIDPRKLDILKIEQEVRSFENRLREYDVYFITCFLLTYLLRTSDPPLPFVRRLPWRKRPVRGKPTSAHLQLRRRRKRIFRQRLLSGRRNWTSSRGNSLRASKRQGQSANVLQ